jgi:hypothetical protein
MVCILERPGNFLQNEKSYLLQEQDASILTKLKYRNVSREIEFVGISALHIVGFY